MSYMLKPHPKDPMTLVANCAASFWDATNIYGPEHGAIWDRAHPECSSLHDEYKDIFNNVSGIRDQIAEFFANNTPNRYPFPNQIRAWHIPNKGISFFDVLEKDITDQFNEILDQLPHLKHDIEFAVKRIQTRKSKRDYATIWLLNDHVGTVNQRELPFKTPHTDPSDTLYIQVGGAKLHIVKFGTPNYDEDNFYSPNNGDMIFMRGKNYPPFRTMMANLLLGNPSNNYRPMEHFGNQQKISAEGRIAFSII